MRLLSELKKFFFCKAMLWAVVFVIIVILALIAVTDTSPTWIYQGF